MSALLVEDAIFNELKQEEMMASKLGQQLRQITESSQTIMAYGVNPTTMLILKSMALVSSTAMDKIAIESLSNDNSNPDESLLALEALEGGFKEKIAHYSAKILSVVSTGASKFWAVVEDLGSRIKAIIVKMGEAGWDAVKEGASYTKAHPVKVCLSILGAIASVAAIMVYSASNLPGAGQSRQVYKAFSDKVSAMIGKIAWPFGKVSSYVDDASRFKIDVVFPSKTAAAIPVEKLGWNYHAAKAIGTHVDRIIVGLKNGFSVFGTKMTAVVKTAGHATFGAVDKFRKTGPSAVYRMTGSAEAAHATSFAIGGIIFGTILSICWAIWRLVKKIVIGGLRLIWNTLTSIF